MRIAVLLIRGVPASHLLTPVDLLTELDPTFDVELVGVDDRPVRRGSVAISPVRTIGESATFDLVVVPTLGFDVAAGLDDNRRFLGWLRQQADDGAVIASWCTGSLLVAGAGLLDGRQATTHWAAARDFASRFPEVELRPERMLVDSGDIVTSGGATTMYLLVMHLIERFVGPDVARTAARECLVDLHRPSQLAYDDGRSLVDHPDDVILELQRFITDHLREDLSMDALARRAGISVRTLSRRFKVATGLSPAAFVQHARVNAAREALLATDRSVEAITEAVGYVDPRAFRRLFGRITGVSPTHYRRLSRQFDIESHYRSA